MKKAVTKHNTTRRFSGVKMFPVHDMKAYMWSSSTAPLILNLDTKRRWVTSRLSRLNPGEEPRYPQNIMVGGPLSRYGRFREDKNLFPPPGFEPRTVQPRIQSLYQLRLPVTPLGVFHSVLPSLHTDVSDRPAGAYLPKYTALTRG